MPLSSIYLNVQVYLLSNLDKRSRSQVEWMMKLKANDSRLLKRFHFIALLLKGRSIKKRTECDRFASLFFNSLSRSSMNSFRFHSADPFCRRPPRFPFSLYLPIVYCKLPVCPNFLLEQSKDHNETCSKRWIESEIETRGRREKHRDCKAEGGRKVDSMDFCFLTCFPNIDCPQINIYSSHSIKLSSR